MCNEVGKKKRQGRDKMIMGKRNKMAVKNNRKNKEKKKKNHSLFTPAIRWMLD